MTDLYGSYFQYNGQSSEPYHLVFANIETKRNKQVYGSIKSTTMFNKKNHTRHLIDDNYEDFPFSFEIEIVTEDGRVINENDRRTIEKWLFNQSSYKKLYIYNCNDDTGASVLGSLYLNCRLINPERVEYNGGIVGYYATLEADSGSWWEDVEVVFENNNDDALNENVHTFTHAVDVLHFDYIYPDIEVVMKSTIDGASRSFNHLQIRNNSDQVLSWSDSSGSYIASWRTLRLSDISNSSTVIINNETNQVTQNGVTINYNNIISADFPRLINGNNVFYVKGGDASVKLKYRIRRAIV